MIIFNEFSILLLNNFLFVFRTLNFNKHPIYIGGLASADPVLERPGQIHSDDFVGCMHSVSINGRALNLSSPIKSKGILPTCNRKQGSCSQALPQNPTLTRCGGFSDCSDRFHYSMCRCGGDLLSPDCYNSLDAISLSDGGFVEFLISEKHRRMQLLESFYFGMNAWSNDYGKRSKRSQTPNNGSFSTADDGFDVPKSMSMSFRTLRPNGLIFYTATNKHYTSVELRNGKIHYQSKQSYAVNMTINSSESLADGKWHNVTLYSYNRALAIYVDGKRVGDELDAPNVHDFLDPYLTTLSIGSARRELFAKDSVDPSFEGCFANFTINNEIQPFNGSGSIFKEIRSHGRVYQGCHSIAGIGAAQTTDPLSIGITLVIIFFVILLVAIFASFVVFRLRKQYKEKSGGPGSIQNKHSAGSTLLAGSGLGSSTSDCVISRGLHASDTSVGFHGENADIIRPHHIVGPELISKKYKERDISTEHQRPQRPDIIEREVVSKSPPLPNQHHAHDHPGGVDLSESGFPEHYDLENASSIAPSDIDVVYHYKGYREAGGVRKYKATPPPVSSYTHHKHTPSAPQQQHRHSPHHASPFPRIPLQTSQTQSTNGIRQHQSTPLARLSPSSELSSQRPRILTLHDISGKPLQSALLATTSSSGGVGKDALHSNSERSLNSPVMSQLSGQSSSASRTKPAPPQPKMKAVSPPMGLTAEEIQRLNVRPRTSSLVSTLSSEVPRAGGSHHLSHLHSNVDAQSSTSTDESDANDSFTCSEIEYDDLNRLDSNREILDSDRQIDSDRENERSDMANKPPPLPPPSYDGFDSSFRGSLSTLVASDDELSNHISNMYRPQNAASPSTLGWDYLLNWGLNFEKLMGVFNDIAELPDSVNGSIVSPIRHMPSNVQNPSEEYV